MIGCLILAGLFMVAGTGDKTNTAKVTFKDKLWDLKIDLPGFEIHQNAPDKLQAEDKKTQTMITITLEPAAQEGDATVCRDYYAGKLKKSPLPQDDIKTSEKGEMALREYMVKRFAGETLNQKNLNAYLVHDGIWIDIHFSRLNWGEESMRDFETILNTVRFDKLSAHVLISSNCDLKKIETVMKCRNCNRLLTYFSCPKCDREKKEKHEIELSEKEETIIPAKCPECGGPITQNTRLNGQEDCAKCRVKPETQVPFCVKCVYQCPEHKTFQMLQAGSCNEVITDDQGGSHKCGKKLELAQLVYSPVIYVYECPKCKNRAAKPGKCAICQQERIRKKTCLSSGKYPHINEADLKK